MFLSAIELQELTGYKYCSLQIQWLKDHGYKFDTKRNGAPIVLRAHVEKRLGGELTKTYQYEEPDFSHLSAG